MSLEEQQKRVDSLQHMVVVVDGSNADSGGTLKFGKLRVDNKKNAY